MPPGSRVVLVVRVSSREQELGCNLADEVANLRREAERRGLIVIGIHAYVGSGWNPDLYPALTLAWEHGAVILAESVDRLMRPRDFHSQKNPTAVLSLGDLRTLHHLAAGIQLYTLVHPDASPGAVRSYQTKRGQAAKGSRGGRPVKGRDAFRLNWQGEALRLHDAGWSLRAVAAEISRLGGRPITYQSIRNWLLSFGRGTGGRHA
jgi:hypothetical protein